MRVRARANRAARRMPGLAAPRCATKGVAVLSRALAGVAETRAFAFLLSERSAGIKDLRHRLFDRRRLARLQSRLRAVSTTAGRSSSSRTSATMSSPPPSLATLRIRLAA